MGSEWQVTWPTVVEHAQLWVSALPWPRGAAVALGNFTVATVPGHGNSVLGLSLLHWLLTGRPSVRPVMPNTAILNVIPCIFQAGCCAQPWARCPCAVSLFSGRQSASLGRPCASPPRLRGQTAGVATLPPCPSVVLKLQDNVNFVSLAQQGCSSTQEWWRLLGASCAAG